jgi:hypothetical protein
MQDMAFVVLKLTIFQWAGQFVISTSYLTPEIPGSGWQDSDLFHPPAKFTTLSDV